MTFSPTTGAFTADYDESYVVGAAVAESQQGMAIFLPDPDQHPKPSGGYPLFLYSGYGGFATAAYGTTIPYTSPQTLLWRLLYEQGIAVAWVGFTGTYAGIGGPQNTTSNGRGLFHPPGTAGWTDDLRYSAQKEAVLAVQLARHRASTWGIDGSKMVGSGNSSGYCAFAAPAFWPDQADGSKSDHRQQSSRLLGIHAGAAQHDFAIYDDTKTIPTNFNCLPSASGDITKDLATSFSDAPSGYVRWISALQIGTDTTAIRALNGTGLYLWSHVHDAGDHMSSVALTGSFTPTTGKTPVETSVDANLSLALHESGQAHLMFQSLKETETDSWHSEHSVLVMDSAARSYVLGLDSTMGQHVGLIRAYGLADPEIIDAEIAWLSQAMHGVTEGREIVYQDSTGDESLTLKATMTASDGETFASGIPMFHFGAGLYKAHVPSKPLAPADRYTVEIYDSTPTLLSSFALVWTGTSAASAAIADVMSVSPEYPVRLYTRKRGVESDSKTGASHRRTTVKSSGTQSSLEAVRRWGLTWRMATQTEADRIFAIFENTRGGVLPMAFTPPGDTLTTVRFTDDSLSIVQVGPNQFSINVELEEMTNYA